MNYSNAADNKSIYLQITKTGKSAFFLDEFLGFSGFHSGFNSPPLPPPLSSVISQPGQAKAILADV